MKDEFITVPILENFQNDKVTGELKIRTDALPVIPGFVFSIGFKCLEKPDSAPGEIPRTAYKGPYELMCVSLVADENYIGYLRQVGKLPPDSGAKIPEADGWMPAAEFPPKAGRYEVHGAPQGKRDFYFDGAHWHLHDESRTDLDVRSYGCPGPLWRPASAS